MLHARRARRHGKRLLFPTQPAGSRRYRVPVQFVSHSFSSMWAVCACHISLQARRKCEVFQLRTRHASVDRLQAHEVTSTERLEERD